MRFEPQVHVERTSALFPAEMGGREGQLAVESLTNPRQAVTCRRLENVDALCDHRTAVVDDGLRRRGGEERERVCVRMEG